MITLELSEPAGAIVFAHCSWQHEVSTWRDASAVSRG